VEPQGDRVLRGQIHLEGDGGVAAAPGGGFEVRVEHRGHPSRHLLEHARREHEQNAEEPQVRCNDVQRDPQPPRHGSVLEQVAESPQVQRPTRIAANGVALRLPTLAVAVEMAVLERDPSPLRTFGDEADLDLAGRRRVLQGSRVS